MSTDDESTPSDGFTVLLPVAMGLITVALVVLESRVATAAGVAGGLALVATAGLVGHRERNRE